MRIVIRKSPIAKKKFRASVYDRGKVDVVDFGGAGYSDLGFDTRNVIIRDNVIVSGMLPKPGLRGQVPMRKKTSGVFHVLGL